jgi:glycosyltransferase involved in cell wall biosynthesis
MRPKVSTITPCFKMKKYLKVFLDDLPKQTYFDQLEVVLDHNEPDDEEVEWVKEFQKKYPNKIKHLIVSKVDPIGISMNRCITESTGEVLTIWNVDDLRTPDSIELQINTMNEKNADIIYGDYIIVKKFQSTSGKLIQHDGISENEFTRSMIFGPFLMFKKKLCDKAGYFDEQLKSGADFDFSVRLALNGKAAKVKGILGYYLNEGLGASTRPNSLQPVERTVIELRYGICDKLDYDYFVEAFRYDIKHIIHSRNLIPIERYVPDYENFINERKKKWYLRGIFLYNAKKLFLIKKSKRLLKNLYHMFLNN